MEGLWLEVDKGEMHMKGKSAEEKCIVCFNLPNFQALCMRTIQICSAVQLLSALTKDKDEQVYLKIFEVPSPHLLFTTRVLTSTMTTISLE